MSAWVVEDDTVNLIVAWMRANDSCWVRELGYDVKDNPGELAKDMFTMNVDAVKDRYPDDRYTYTFKYRDVPLLSDVAVYKAIRCYLYQCNEGNISSRNLYLAIERCASSLAHRIVASLPEFREADTWR